MQRDAEQKFKEVADKLRSEGIVLRVNCTDRDHEHNKEVGGAPDSRHLHGDAIDYGIGHLKDSQKQRVIEEFLMSGATGFGVYMRGAKSTGALHIDYGHKQQTIWGKKGTYDGQGVGKWMPDWAQNAFTKVKNIATGKKQSTAPTKQQSAPQTNTHEEGEHQEETPASTKDEPNFFQKIFGSLGDVFSSLLSALIALIFGNNLDKGVDGDDAQTNTAPSTPADKNKTFKGAGKIGKISVSDQAEQKRLDYMAAHKGEKVEFHSPITMNAGIRSGVGPRNTGIKGASKWHEGADIAAVGDVLAAASGIVIVSGKFGTAGNTVIIAHADGTFTSYMHMKDGSAFPQEGTEVLQGQKIGIIGNTSTIKNMARHLHFEVRDEDRHPMKPKIAGITLDKGATCKGNHSHGHDYAGLTDRKGMFPSADVHDHGGHNAPSSKPSSSKSKS